jgi:RecA/RadA recombinase
MGSRGHKLTLQNAEQSIFEAEIGNNKTRLDVPLTGIVNEAGHTDWLWANRIPRGRVTLIEGEAGAGKSFVALDLAARMTSGAA